MRFDLLAQRPNVPGERAHGATAEIGLGDGEISAMRLPVDLDEGDPETAAKDQERRNDPQQMTAAVQDALRARHGAPPSCCTRSRSRAVSSFSAANSVRSAATSTRSSLRSS